MVVRLLCRLLASAYPRLLCWSLVTQLLVCIGAVL